MDRLDRSPPSDPTPLADRVTLLGPGGRYRGEYEIRVVDFARDVARSEIRRLLTEDAEYGQWELVRSRVFVGGRRRTWLRRKIIKVREGRGPQAHHS